MIHKAMIYPKFWAHLKKFQMKRVQDHEHRLLRKALGHKVITYPSFLVKIQNSFSKVREPKIMSML